MGSTSLHRVMIIMIITRKYQSSQDSDYHYLDNLPNYDGNNSYTDNDASDHPDRQTYWNVCITLI